MACTDCKDSILNKTGALIPDPVCKDDCPQDVACPDTLPANCVLWYGGTLTCLGITNGDTLNDIVAAMEARCENVDVPSGICTAKISSADGCCGYLEDKIIAGDGIDITKSISGDCETLVISETCFTWNTVQRNGAATGAFVKKWKNASTLGSDYQNAQYSNEKECTIRLRGTTYNGSYNAISDNKVFVLPVNKRPLHIRRFNVNAYNIGTSSYVPGVIDIDASGNVYVYLGISTGAVVVSLDGIYFETD